MGNFQNWLSKFTYRLVPQRPCQFIGLTTIILSFNTLLVGLGLIYGIAIPLTIGLFEIVLGSWLIKNGTRLTENKHDSSNNHATNRRYYNCPKCLIHRNHTQSIESQTKNDSRHSSNINNKANSLTHNTPPTKRMFFFNADTETALAIKRIRIKRQRLRSKMRSKGIIEKMKTQFVHFIETFRSKIRCHF